MNSDGQKLAPAVEVEGLTKAYPDVVAVDHIDLSVQQGEFLSLLGPSGCGKTTTLRMIGGLDFPTAGTIRIGGRDVTTAPPNRRPTSIVFQDYALFPHMSVLDNTAFGLKMRGVSTDSRRKRGQAMLDLVNLGQHGGRKPHQLSGGQRQRVALARSLIIEPDVLLLDEPLGALDALIRRQMQTELHRLQRQLGLTFLYVTHDQEEAMAMSDRLVVMHAGRIAQVGTPDDVYRRPRTEFVARFLGECNVFSAVVGEAVSGTVEAQVELLGTLTVKDDRMAPNLTRGDQCLAAVRPEHMKIGAVSDGGITGRVVERSYLGARTRFVVAANDHHIVVVTEGGSDHTLGEEVGISCTVDSVCLVEPAQDSSELNALFAES